MDIFIVYAHSEREPSILPAHIISDKTTVIDEEQKPKKKLAKEKSGFPLHLKNK